MTGYTKSGKTADKNQWDYCPVCGWFHQNMSPCHPNTVRAIDAAHHHADLEPGLDRQRTESNRLFDGLSAFDEDDDR